MQYVMMVLYYNEKLLWMHYTHTFVCLLSSFLWFSCIFLGFHRFRWFLCATQCGWIWAVIISVSLKCIRIPYYRFLPVRSDSGTYQYTYRQTWQPRGRKRFDAVVISLFFSRRSFGKSDRTTSSFLGIVQKNVRSKNM